MTDNSKLIAQYNDAFRKDLGNPNPFDIKIPGRYMMTGGIASLPNDQQIEVAIKTREFNDFNESNDPHGEHDCGRFQLENNKKDIIWKIDYYDENYEFGSEDPADLAKTKRVLTTMLPCEY